MKYRQSFKKIVYGFFEVEADSVKEAERKFYEAEYEEFDNKSDYETEEWYKVKGV